MGEVEVWRLKSCRGLNMSCWARVVIWGDNAELAIELIDVGVVMGEDVIDEGVGWMFVGFMTLFGV